MKRDRRYDTRIEDSRRRSARIADYRAVWWSRSGDRQPHHGWLVDWSAHGVALVVEAGDLPAPGESILPCRRHDIRGWHRPVTVTRVAPLSGLLRLVAAEYASAEPQGDLHASS
jgi:hypothetical protein